MKKRREKGKEREKWEKNNGVEFKDGKSEQKAAQKLVGTIGKKREFEVGRKAWWKSKVSEYIMKKTKEETNCTW